MTFTLYILRLLKNRQRFFENLRHIQSDLFEVKTAPVVAFFVHCKPDFLWYRFAMIKNKTLTIKA